MTTIRVETYGIVEERPRGSFPFWLLLGVGVAWLVLSFLMLQFTYRSITTLAILVGVVFFLAAAAEFGEAFIAPGWKWAHALLGVLFTFGGVWAFVYPGQTFGTLAVLFGWYLLVKGTFDVVWSLMMLGTHLWWLGFIAGILQIVLAFWAVGYQGRSAALLVLWVGIGAALRGITTIVVAFQIRRSGQGALT
jgi:uncharacterized membrane protein HdeD (DUF308 family)